VLICYNIDNMSMKPMLSKEYIRKVKSLYYNKGYSAREVAEELKVSIDAVYKFMIRHGLERRTFEETNRIRFEKKPLSYCIKKKLTEREKRLKVAGIMLYWAEGANPNPQRRGWMIDLANSDPRMIKIFLRFLRVICGVDESKLRVYLYAYGDQNIKKLLKYWHNLTDIPLKQFTKPYIREDFSLEKSGKMKYGLIHVRYNDKKLLLQIMSWVDEHLKKEMC